MRVMLVGGGTGGHFYPLIATVEALPGAARSAGTKPPELYYIGPEPYNESLLATFHIRYVSCPAGKVRRYFSLKNGIDFIKNLFGIAIAFWKLLFIYPDVLVSKGGYTSVGPVIAAWLLRIPIVVHESDAVPGSANKLASRFARYVGIAYDDAAAYFPNEKTARIGIPTRRALLTAPQKDPHEMIGVPKESPVILVLGGSQGAERVNQLILDSLDELLPHYTIIHQVGNAHLETVVATARALITDEALLTRYRPVAFLEADTLNAAMYAARIVIARAGSTTIHEIAQHGKPSILIPIPEEISHDQRTNAYAYARTGAATVMEEGNLRDGLLATEINRMMSDDAMYAEVVKAARSFAIDDAADKLAAVIVAIGKEHE